MATYLERDALRVDETLAHFIEEQALPGTGVSATEFWAGMSGLAHDLGPKNKALLARREDLQSAIDTWHIQRRGTPHDHDAYRDFLEEIGYLLPEGEDFQIDTANVDPEIAKVPGPQLVVPVNNARYALNAANARWGSLYDVLLWHRCHGKPAKRRRVRARPWRKGCDPRAGLSGRGISDCRREPRRCDRLSGCRRCPPHGRKTP